MLNSSVTTQVPYAENIPSEETNILKEKLHFRNSFAYSQLQYQTTLLTLVTKANKYKM